MTGVVMDASAVLALLNNEPGCELVQGLLCQAVISAVSLAEVVARLSAAGMPETAIREALALLGMKTAAFDEDQTIPVGLLRTQNPSGGLSLGERACLALAQKLNIPAVTANRSWKDLPLQVPIQLIR